MSDILTFRRVEKKYRINEEKKAVVLNLASDRLCPDEHGKSTICSLYLDTPDFHLIRNSMDAVSYKEKLRVRSYGTPEPDGHVFFEIKKKYNNVIYKRREAMSLTAASDYIRGSRAPVNSQIMREIDYAMNFYCAPKPSMLICYEREAYFCIEDSSLRITFDSAVRYRRSALHLQNGCDGCGILPDGELIMEIKTGGAMPVWLSDILNCLKIYPTSFSKYASAYKNFLTETQYLKRG